ncbi:LysM peptidoglycan-binding domain-containing protein [bacterium D16-51]|nr:LysM peptidoglycan-binding domain-containing protein [bacterium D16-59]RKI56668.1 LysM peptidoglycan-binding domain-containing protein [bacterium D16-51]
MTIYVVQPNDTVDAIAESYQVPVDNIIYINQLAYPYALAIGQALLIPTADEEQERRSVVTNGYAYPFINQGVLESTLPYLTNLSIFSYGFTGQGELIPPALNDTWMIEAAAGMGVNAILTLTPMDEEGRFSNILIHQMVNDEAAKSALIQNLLVTMGEKGYQGIDVDFEYILAEDRDAFTAFVAELTEIMNANGYETSVALAPKTSSTQRGLLYEGKDYRGLGAAANSVLLMTYEWGYTYGPPMAVAPIDKVREVVEYAVTEIPVDKINLGIPNYGYDWPLPFEKGVTKASTIGNVQAVQLAIEYGAVINFDETAQSPYFHYIENGVEHEVWFEDVRSMQAKFDLVKEFSLRGMGYWQLMRLFLANWVLLDNEFIIE